nr:plasminogen-like [Lytechinus pictus]
MFMAERFECSSELFIEFQNIELPSDDEPVISASFHTSEWTGTGVDIGTFVIGEFNDDINLYVGEVATEFENVDYQPECYTDPQGLDYRGFVSVSENGHVCKNWLLQSIVNDTYNSGLGDHNYCRTPSINETAPVCIIEVDPLIVEYCNVGPPQTWCGTPYAYKTFVTMGAEDGRLNNILFSASSFHSERYPPSSARLNQEAATFHGKYRSMQSVTLSQMYFLCDPHPRFTSVLRSSFHHSGQEVITLGGDIDAKLVGDSYTFDMFMAERFECSSELFMEFQNIELPSDDKPVISASFHTSEWTGTGVDIGTFVIGEFNDDINLYVGEVATEFENVNYQPECYTDPQGLDYRGFVSVSENGHACKNWLLQSIVNDTYNSGLGDHNYCRTPSINETAPVCIIEVDPLTVEYCNVGPPQTWCGIPYAYKTFVTMGAEDGRLNNILFSASSFHSERYPPSSARLNQEAGRADIIFVSPV